MARYINLPVTGEKIRGGFRFADGEALTREDEERLAAVLDGLVRTAGHAIWMNPETDRSARGARVFGRPLEVDGRAVRYIPGDEGAIFPHETDNN